MKLKASTNEFLKLRNILTNSNIFEEKEKAKEDIIKMSTDEIENIIRRYAEQRLESKSVLNKKFLKYSYNFNRDDILIHKLTTLHPIFDFKQDCIIHLFDVVVPQYDPSKGAAFKTFLYQSLRGFMQRNYQKNYRTISLPPNFTKNYSKDTKKEFWNVSSERKEELLKEKKLFLNPYDSKFEEKSKFLKSKNSNYKENEELIDFIESLLTKKEYTYLKLSIINGLKNKEIAKLENKTPQSVSKIIISAKNKIKNSKIIERMWT